MRSLLAACILTLCTPAWAQADPQHDLELERGRAALREGRPGAALDFANAALASSTSWQAAWMYLDACDAAGALAGCMGAYEGLASGEPVVDSVHRWALVRHELAPADIMGEGVGGDVTVRTLGLAWLALDDGSPEVTLALLDDRTDADAMSLRLQALVWQERDKDAAALAARLVDEHPDRPDALIGLWERNPVGKKTGKARKKVLTAAAAQVDGAIDPVVVYRVLSLAIRADDDPLAENAVAQLVALGEERPLARHVWNQAMRRDLARGLGMVRNPLLPETTADELEDIAVATANNLRDMGRVDEALGVYEDARARHDSAYLAIEHANQLLRMSRLKDAKKVALEGVRLASRPPGDDVGGVSTHRAEQLATAWAVLGMVQAGREEVPDALVSLVTATELYPYGEWFMARGQLQAQMMDTDAAFASFSIANALGVRGAEGLMEQSYTGPGNPHDAAFAIVKAWSERRPNAQVAVALERSVEAEAKSRSERPGVGKAVKDFELRVDDEVITNADFDGQVVVYAFWASWCAPCQEELPALAEVARRLQSQDVPAAFVAVSVDSQERAFKRWKPLGDVEGLQIAWSPDMGIDWRVSALPTTWIADAEGTLRFVHTGFQSGVENEVEAHVLELVP